MVERVAEMFRVPNTNQLAHEEVIRFQVKNQRVYHEGFALEFGTMSLATQGSVSLADQSLDVTLAIRLPEFANKTAPVRAALSGQTLTLPIRGTLGHPTISPEAIRQSGFGLLAGVVDALSKDRPITAEAIQAGLREGKLLGQTAAGAKGSTQQGATAAAGGENATSTAPAGPAFPILEEILRERAALRERRREEAAAQGAAAPPLLPPEPPGSRERPLRRGARRLLDALAQPPGEPTPPPKDAAGGEPQR